MFQYNPSRAGWLSVLLLSVFSTGRADVQLSGFGTLGGAIADQDFVYQRYLDDGGTLHRDSLLGLQLDAELIGPLSVTLQAKIAPATDDDNAWEPSLSWAFFSWRPSNERLLRVGKLRLPLMLYSANSDVGMTFDFARLPTELYSLLPTADLYGVSFTRTWFDREREWSLEGYAGQMYTEWRYYLRDNAESPFPTGTIFWGCDLNMAGLVLSLRDREHIWRLGVHRTDALTGPMASRYPFVTLVPGTDIGYYKISSEMPGPDLPLVDKYILYVLTLGAEIALPYKFRLVGEYGQRRIDNAAIIGPNTHAGYLALLTQIGRWTPYLYWAGIRSRGPALELAEALNRNRIPSFIPGAAALTASQRAGSDILGAYDQQSWAIGTSYSLSPTSKLKLEWMHARTGILSNFVDSPADEDSGGRQINVFSLSYHFTF